MTDQKTSTGTTLATVSSWIDRVSIVTTPAAAILTFTLKDENKWLLVILCALLASGLTLILSRALSHNNASQAPATVVTVLLVVAALVLVIFVVRGRPLPWKDAPAPGNSELFAERMDTAESRARRIADSAVESWMPTGFSVSAGGMEFRLATSPQVLRVNATQWDYSGRKPLQTTSPTYATLLRFDIDQLHNTTDRHQTVTTVCDARDRPTSAGTDIDAAPATPLLVINAPDGEVALGRYIPEHPRAWQSSWYRLADPAPESPESIGLSSFQNNTGSPVTDQYGRTLYRRFGSLDITAPLCAEQSSTTTDTRQVDRRVIGQQTSPPIVGDGIDVSLAPGEKKQPGKNRAPWQLVFMVPSPSSYEYASFNSTEWTPLEKTNYPFHIGGLYLVSDDYSAVGVRRI